MKNLKKYLAVLLTLAMMVGLMAACAPEIPAPPAPGTTVETTKAPSSNDNGGGNTPADNPSGNEGQGDTPPATTGETVYDKYEKGTSLRMGVGYNNVNTGIAFDADTAGEGITLANGKTYNTGDLKPTWEKLEEILGVEFESVYQGNGDSKEFEYWEQQMSQVDLVSGTAAQLSENGTAGKIVDINQYLDMMPNLKAYLDANPIVKLSIVSDVKTGAFYYAPYFDGVNDIERMFLMRVDWVQKLLNGDGAFSADSSDNTATPVYQPFMPTSGSIEIETVNKDGTGTETVTKNYDAYGNIIAKMNEVGSMSGVDAVNMLRDYIDATYGGYYGTDRADLFIGQNACWDADELVALVRCVVANSATLNADGTKVQGIFAREENKMSRRLDMLRMAGCLFGVRGVESRKDWLYVDSDGNLADARTNPATWDAMARMNALAQEGLISADFLAKAETKSENYLESDSGFMSYDYNQTQTLYNDSKLQDGEAYRAVMVPVSRWYDGSNADGVYMRFTESWRSVKSGGWGISADGVAGNDNKLYALLSLIDYAYSKEGQILMSYGPDEFIKTNADGSYVTFNFNGEEWPEISDATKAELWDKQGGNYTNYARRLLGSTLSYVKSQAFEYQCTTDIGKEGAGYISTAIALGTIKHPKLELTGDWYTIVPTTLPTTKTDNEAINQYTELQTMFSMNDDNVNELIELIVGGYSAISANGLTDADAAAARCAGDWHVTQYLDIQNLAWQDAVDYYNS